MFVPLRDTINVETSFVGFHPHAITFVTFGDWKLIQPRSGGFPAGQIDTRFIAWTDFKTGCRSYIESHHAVNDVAMCREMRKGG